MTPLEDHVARAETAGSYVLEVCQDIPGDPDAPAQPGFVMMMRDNTSRIMLAELSIAGDGAGLSAVISTYADDGEPWRPTLSTFENQVIVSVD